MKVGKLSEAIKAGSKGSKQAFGAFFGTDTEHDMKVEFMDGNIKMFGDGSGAISYKIKDDCLFLYDPDKEPFAFIPLSSIKLVMMPNNGDE